MTSFERNLGGEDVFKYETTVKGKDGEPVQLSVNSIVARDDAGEVVGVTGTARDISARAAAEGAVREAEAKYRGLVERLPAIAYIGDPGARGLALREPPDRGHPRLLAGGVDGGADPGSSACTPRTASASSPRRRWRSRTVPAVAFQRLPHDRPRRKRGLDPRRRAARRVRWPAPVARRVLRHHRHEERRGGARAPRRPAGRGCPARRARARGMTLAGLMDEASARRCAILDVECAASSSWPRRRRDADRGRRRLARGVRRGLHVPATSRSLAGRASWSPMPPSRRGLEPHQRLDRPRCSSSAACAAAWRSSSTGPAGPFGVLERPRRASAAVRLRRHRTSCSRSANVLADAIDRRAAEDEIRHQALHDPLTGLPNRVLFARPPRARAWPARAAQRRARSACSSSTSTTSSSSTTASATQAGDELLVAVAPRLSRRCARATRSRASAATSSASWSRTSTSATRSGVAERIAARAVARPFVLGGTRALRDRQRRHRARRATEPSARGADPRRRRRDVPRQGARPRRATSSSTRSMRARAVERLRARERPAARARARRAARPLPADRLARATAPCVGFEALVRWRAPRTRAARRRPSSSRSPRRPA